MNKTYKNIHLSWLVFYVHVSYAFKCNFHIPVQNLKVATLPLNITAESKMKKKKTWSLSPRRDLQKSVFKKQRSRKYLTRCLMILELKLFVCMCVCVWIWVLNLKLEQLILFLRRLKMKIRAVELDHIIIFSSDKSRRTSAEIVPPYPKFDFTSTSCVFGFFPLETALHCSLSDVRSKSKYITLS